MRKSSIALAAAVTMIAAPAMTGQAFASSGSNSGSAPAASNGRTFESAPSKKGCTQIDQPDSAYTKATTVADLSGFADFSPVSSVGKVSFTPTLEKRSVPASWGTWGSPPDTESASPNILYTAGATDVTVKIKKGAKTAGFEVEPNPFEVHTFQVTFSKGSKAVCSITVDADGSNGAKLAAVTSKKKAFDTIEVSSDVDFAIAQVRYGKK